MFTHRSTWAHFALIMTILALLIGMQIQVVAQDVPKPDPVGLRPDAPTYALRGPYWIGVRDFVIEDTGGKQSLPIVVWYPALNNDSATQYAVYDMGIGDLIPKDASLINEGHALADNAPAMDSAPYPLVIISHGLGGSRYSYFRVAEHLASYGFVVIGVEHVGTAIRDGVEGTADVGSENNIASLYNRPSDMVRAMAFADTLTAKGGALAGLIDTNRIAVFGHSTGGTTVFQAGGARIDLNALKAWCADKETDEFAAESCQFLGHEGELAALYHIDNSKAGLFPAVWDTRVDAVVAVSPGGELHAFGDDGINAVQVPTMVMVGTADPIVSPDFNAYWAYDHINSQNKSLVKFENGGHVMFVDCPAGWKDFCGYDAVWDIARVRDMADYFTTAFLLDVLKGDKDAHAALLPDAVSFPGITYETTMK